MTNERSRFQEGGELFLHEELLLLALSENGTIGGWSMLSFALASALLAELLMRGRIIVQDTDKHVAVKSREALGDPLLDECLEHIAKATKPQLLQSWVVKFAAIKKLKHRIAEGLCGQRIVQASEDTVLVIFRRVLYPEIHPAAKKRIVERMRKAIFRSTRDVDARTIALVSLAQGAGLLQRVFDKGDLADRKERIKAIIAGEVAGEAAREAVQAAEAAAMVAVIAASVAASSSSRR